MNKKRWGARAFLSSARRSQQGLSLIEVLLATAILAAVGVTFLSAMTTSSKAVAVNNEQTTAEGLAKSQMELVKRQDYRTDMNYAELDPGQVPTGYDIQIVGEYMNPRGDGPHNDDGLQKITITISHNGRAIFTLEGYKCFLGQ